MKRPYTARPFRLTAAAITLAAWAFVAASVRAAPATGGDFQKVDFVAAAPGTYSHLTGGGAYDDRTVGENNDVTEQLEGTQFRCGDIITFLVAVNMAATVVDPVQSGEFDFGFLADSTGQSGAAVTDIVQVAINYGPVAGGDGPGGTDAHILDDGGSTATLVSQTLTGPLFTPGSQLKLRVRISDLEAGERLVLRIDARLGCQPYTNPTGNLQARLDAGRVAATGSAVATGQQTIPFLKIGDIAGTGEPLLMIHTTVATASGTCGRSDAETLTTTVGSTVRYCYVVQNPGTADLYDLQTTDDNATPGQTTDDFPLALSGLRNLDSQGDAYDLGSGSTATATVLVTLNAVGSRVNTATTSGNNGLSGGSLKLLTAADAASVTVVYPPTATPTSTATPMPSPTPSPMPTGTAPPTQTPSPTPSPIPTGTVPPTATAAPTVNPSELVWQSRTVLVAYEDQKRSDWSDWDYNDLVVRLTIAQGTTRSGKLAELRIDYEALARGAAFNHRFRHALPILGAATTRLVVRDADGGILGDRTTITGDRPDIVVFGATREALPPVAGFRDTNTRNAQPGEVAGHSATLTVQLQQPNANPQSALPPIPWDPYIEVLNTGQAVHLVIPGHLDNQQAVNGAHEPGNPMLGQDLPLATVFEPGWEWPVERSGIWHGYPLYVDYVASGKTTAMDWHAPDNAVPGWLWAPGNGPRVLGEAASMAGASEADRSLAGAEPPTKRYFAGPTTADLDGDGTAEILLGTLLTGQVEVYDHQGRGLPGWPQTVTGDVKGGVTAADLDLDGRPEVLAGASDGRLYAWHANGRAVAGWPAILDARYRVLAQPAVGDVDGDGRPDVVVPLSDGRLYALDAGGRQLAGWPASIGGSAERFGEQMLNSSPTIADLDGDGQPEVVVGSTDHRLYALSGAGSVRWTLATGDLILSSPAVADIDPGRAGLEVAVASGDSYVYLTDKDGSLLWRRATGWTVRSSPAVADLDGDGRPEIVLGGDDDRLWAWHGDGQLVAGWPQAAAADLVSPPAVGDIDGDGRPEVVAGCDDGRVYAWRADGTAVTGWPRLAGQAVKGRPALVNLDADPALEVVVGDHGGSVHVWHTASGARDRSAGTLYLPMVSRTTRR